MAPQTNNNGNATLPVKHNERSMAGESKEDRENGSQAAMVRGNLGPRRATSPTHQNSPTRPQHLQSTPDHQDEVSRLRAELAAAKSEISSLRVELSQQQYELEEVNLIINLQDEGKFVENHHYQRVKGLQYTWNVSNFYILIFFCASFAVQAVSVSNLWCTSHFFDLSLILKMFCSALYS